MTQSLNNIAIVILNWNGKHFLEKFLPILILYSADAQIIIGDNASTDDSLIFIKTNYPKIVNIELDNNYGFCEGYNRTLKNVKADFFILLNSDVEVTENWILPMIQLLKSDTKIAVCQPKLKQFDQKNSYEYAGAAGGMIDHFGYPFCRGRIFDKLELDLLQFETATEIFWSSGACMAIKSSVFNQLSGFDNDFFAHMEEIDLCWRIQNMGLKVYFCPQSTVYHVGGGTLHKINPFKTYLNFRNGLFLLHKNLPSEILISTIIKRLILDGIAGIYMLMYGDFMHTIAVLKAHFVYYFNIKKLNKKRKALSNDKLPSTVYKKSIVYQFFISKKRTFLEL